MSLRGMVIAAGVLALALTWLLLDSLQPSDAEYISVQQALSGISMAEMAHHRDGALVADTVALLAPSLPVRIGCDIRVAETDASVTADPTQMQQVLVNLLRNAAQASEGGTPVMVTVETSNLARRRTLSHGTIEAGSCVRICVVDQGIGTPADV
ncbi:MAG: hypothetical protein ACRYGP_11995 [Janthinobacterium lividum]